MAPKRMTVLRHGSGRWEVGATESVATVDRLKVSLRGGELLRHLFRYDEARILTHRLDTIGRPLKLALFLRVLSRGRCFVEDEGGHQRPLAYPLIARWAWQAIREPFGKARLLQSIDDEAAALVTRAAAEPPRRLTSSHQPLYLRTDLSFGLKAGGSVGHIAGVINHLHAFGGAPVMLTTDVVPTVDPAIEVHLVPPAEAFWEYPELPSLVMNSQFQSVAAATVGSRPVSFVYQRYSLNSYAGARFAVHHRVPYVMEYNGSEIWMSRHWGSPLEHEALSQRIELANLQIADLVVVVSQPMADELMARGVPRDKILVNPNGVEPDRYSPGIDGSEVRIQHGLVGKTVIGFIGTMGPWHGAEVLAAAFAKLLASHPEYRETVRLLMIGDGVKMGEVTAALEAGGVGDLTVLAGIVPQAEGPRYLAACDILASPHVPNPDGTPFFGSPTKLFEYMAMGKGIVASDLDQVGEILEHGRAAQMTVPGNVDSLVEGLRVLVEDPTRREALGAEARRLAVARHSWREHTRRIIQALTERVPVS
ncbi:MAG: glycosyltransferase [Acidobacteriota bacterium]|nr:glycosyltransferase [Acidobacteriota bacterium]